MLTGRGHKVSVLAVDPSSCTTGGKHRSSSSSQDTDEELLALQYIYVGNCNVMCKDVSFFQTQ